MFWDKFTPTESDRYYFLMKLTQPWLGWCSLSKTKRQQFPEPYRPTDQELIDLELLSMKGWGMID
jgi:hypothetical protein